MQARHTLAAVAVTLLLVGCGGPGDGSDPVVDAIDHLDDPQALQTLVEAAQDEGSVIWYTSVPSERAEQIASMFESEYSIEVQVQRSGGADILQRFLLEEEAGRVQNDVLTISDPAAFIDLARNDALTCFKPRNLDAVPDYAKDGNGCWAATRINAMVIAYNTSTITDPPTGWKDLLDPRFSDQIAYINPDFSSGALIVTAGLAEHEGWEWFDGLVQNQPFIVKSNNQLIESLVTGERGVGSFVNSTYIAEGRSSGQPVDWVFPEEGIYMVPAPSAVVAGAPNPAAGKLLADFLLTEGVQQLMIDDGNYAAFESMPAPEGQPAVGDMTILDVDYEALADEASSISEQFNSVIGGSR